MPSFPSEQLYKVDVYQQQIDMEKLCHQGELLLKKVSDQTDRDMIDLANSLDRNTSHFSPRIHLWRKIYKELFGLKETYSIYILHRQNCY